MTRFGTLRQLALADSLIGKRIHTPWDEVLLVTEAYVARDGVWVVWEGATSSNVAKFHTLRDDYTILD